MSKQIVIPAVGYLRKSTKEDGHEKSIADQKARIARMKPADDKARYEIIRWYVDPGIPGWKPNHKRPDYFRLVNDLRSRKDFAAVLIDDMDRFSRKDSMETVADVQALRELGIRYIHAANQGIRDLGGNLGMVTMQIAMEANASHEHCTRLSRRITETRRNEALKGIRTGGDAPYGMRNDGRGGLQHGDSKKLKIVRQLFERFAAGESLNRLAGELNDRGVPGPDGKLWFVKAVARILQCRAYRGDFEYGRSRGGQFTTLDSKGELIDKAQLNGERPWAFVKEGVYKPVVERDLFDRVQKRFTVLRRDGERRKNQRHALAGILFCNKCGGRLYATEAWGNVVYRCCSHSNIGKCASGCPQWGIREDVILPYVMRMLGEEIKELESLLIDPPSEIFPPGRKGREQQKAQQDERDALAKKIEQAVERILDIEDRETRQSLDHKIADWRRELAILESELAVAKDSDWLQQDLDALAKWWNDFNDSAVSMPVKSVRDIHPMVIMSYIDKLSPDETAVLIPPARVNEALHQLGAEVRIRWESRDTGRVRNHRARSGRVSRLSVWEHVPVGGRFRLGQRKGSLPPYIFGSSGTRAASSRMIRSIWA